MTNQELIEKLTAIIENSKTRSAWDKGVKAYALDLLEDMESYLDYIPEEITSAATLEEHLLNGAPDWIGYSWGGCSLIYDPQIAKRLCNPTEYKRTKGGQLDPNKSEQWLDTQARALRQAARKIKTAFDEIKKGA